jgi:hypothetical protein
LHPQPLFAHPQPLLPQPQPVFTQPHPLQLLKRRMAAMMMSHTVESSKRLQRQFIYSVASYILDFGILYSSQKLSCERP